MQTMSIQPISPSIAPVAGPQATPPSQAFSKALDDAASRQAQERRSGNETGKPGASGSPQETGKPADKADKSESRVAQRRPTMRPSPQCMRSRPTRSIRARLAVIDAAKLPDGPVDPYSLPRMADILWPHGPAPDPEQLPLTELLPGPSDAAGTLGEQTADLSGLTRREAISTNPILVPKDPEVLQGPLPPTQLAPIGVQVQPGTPTPAAAPVAAGPVALVRSQAGRAAELLGSSVREAAGTKRPQVTPDPAPSGILPIEPDPVQTTGLIAPSTEVGPRSAVDAQHAARADRLMLAEAGRSGADALPGMAAKTDAAPQASTPLPAPAVAPGAFSNLLAQAAGSAGATASAAVPTVEAHVQTRLDSPAFGAAFGAQLSVMARDGVQSARLHLNPAEMGPVTVQISITGHMARVDLVAEQAFTRQMLEQSMPSLAGSLRETGLTLTGGGVFEQPHQPGQAGHADGGRERGGNARQGTTGSGAHGDPLGTVSTAGPRTSHRGVVDLYA